MSRYDAGSETVERKTRSSQGHGGRQDQLEKPIADLTLEMRLGAKQLYYLLVNTVRGKALTGPKC